MKTPRIYCDTSVFGGVYDDLFFEASRRFFELVREGSLILVISPYTTLQRRQYAERLHRDSHILTTGGDRR